MAVETSIPVLAEDRPEYAAKRDELRAAGIRYVLAAYTDVHGVGKAKAVPIDHFTSMMRLGAFHGRGARRARPGAERR